MASRNSRGFLPQSEADLLIWSENFKMMISEAPTTYGLDAAKATAYSTTQEAFATAFQIARDPSTRTRPNVAAKDAAKEELIAASRSIAKVVEGTPSVTDAQKIGLGLTVRKTPTPRPVPADAPTVEVMSVNFRSVMIRLHGDEPGRRGRPTDVAGASIFSFVGDTPNDDPKTWRFETSTTKMSATIDFGTDATPGTKVWVAAFWFNSKSEAGPLSRPASTLIGYGLSAAG